MDINGKTLDAFRADLKEALAPLEDKYCVTITLGRITYEAERFFREADCGKRPRPR